MTWNQAYCGFQGWLQTEKMVTCWEQSAQNVSYIMWWMKIFWVRHFYFIDKLPWNLKRNQIIFDFFITKFLSQSLKLGKFMTNQVANTFSHVWWPCIILTSVTWFCGKVPFHEGKFWRIYCLTTMGWMPTRWRFFQIFCFYKWTF